MAFAILIRTAIMPQMGFTSQVNSGSYSPINTFVHSFDTEAEAVEANQKINNKGTSSIDPRIKTESFLLFTKTP